MPLGDSKPQLLDKYGPYVRSLAAQVRKQFNSQFEMDELVAWGQIGLLEAAERFDPRVGANFLTFAHYRIKGAIYDGLRKMGVLKGHSSASERANSYMGNVSDRAGGSAGSLDDDVKEISSAVAGLAMVFATSLEGTEGLQVSDDQMPADERIELEQLKTRVRGALEKLPEKERKLLQGYYFQSKTLEEAGAEIGQSKSWASRLHARAVEQLKKLLEDDGDNQGKSGQSGNSSNSGRSDHGGTTGRNLSAANRAAENARSGRAASAEERAKQVRPVDESGPAGPAQR